MQLPCASAATHLPWLGSLLGSHSSTPTTAASSICVEAEQLGQLPSRFMTPRRVAYSAVHCSTERRESGQAVPWPAPVQITSMVMLLSAQKLACSYSGTAAST